VSTPLADAQNSAGSPNYSGGGSPGNSASPTTSKKSTSIPKTGGGNGVKGATDSPQSPGDPGSGGPGSSKRISTGAVVGASIVGIIGLAAAAGGILWFVRKKKRDAQGHQIREAPLMERYFRRASQMPPELDGSPCVSPLANSSFVEKVVCMADIKRTA
jgi:LPXTG-motif cell wall-anchored protein